MTAIEEVSLQDVVQSALMHFCELAVAGDPEAELLRATNIFMELFESREAALSQQHEREIGIAEMNGAIGAIEALITLNRMLRQEPSTRQLHEQLERLKGKLTELQEVQNGSHSDNS